MKILAVNPGSTSTKIAVYEDETPRLVLNIRHSVEELSQFPRIIDQFEFRKHLVLEALEANDIPFKFDAIVGRGGLLKPIPGGVYAVNDAMLDDMLHAMRTHACNLGCLIAHELAAMLPGCPSFIADPGVVDELDDVARITGSPLMPSITIWHALNQRAIARRYAAERSALRHFKAYIFQNGLALFVTEIYVSELYIARKFAFSAVLLLVGVHYFAYARDGYARAAHIGNNSAELTNGTHKHCVVRYERHKVAGRYASVKAEKSAYYNKKHALERRKEVVGSPVHGKKLFYVHPKTGIIYVLAFELVALVPLFAERAHNPYACKIFLRDGGKHALFLVAFFERFACFCVKEQRICHKQGYKRRGYEGELYVHHKH